MNQFDAGKNVDAGVTAAGGLGLGPMGLTNVGCGGIRRRLLFSDAARGDVHPAELMVSIHPGSLRSLGLLDQRRAGSVNVDLGAVNVDLGAVNVDLGAVDVTGPAPHSDTST